MMPRKGDKLVYSDKHPYHSSKVGEVFGTVINCQGGIVNVRLENGDTDHVYWRSADGIINPFYEVAKTRS